MKECGRLIGGLWLPIRGSRVYHDIRCNLNAGHPFGNCAYLDEQGGTVVTSTGRPGSLMVNERGWVSELADR